MLGTFGKVQNSLQVDDFSRMVGNFSESKLRNFKSAAEYVLFTDTLIAINILGNYIFQCTIIRDRSIARVAYSQLVAASVMQFSPTSPPRRNLALHSQRDPPKYIIAIFFTKLNTFPQSAKYFGLNSRNFLQLLLPGSERRKKRFPKLLRESSVSVSGRITTR